MQILYHSKYPQNTLFNYSNFNINPLSSRTSLHMGLHRIFPHKTFVACRTADQIFSCVQLQMTMISLSIDELFLTKFTHQRLLHLMTTSMQLHRIETVELLLTDWTRKLLVWILMFCHVRLKAISFVARIRADFTVESSRYTVFLNHVSLPGRLVHENFIAVIALHHDTLMNLLDMTMQHLRVDK